MRPIHSVCLIIVFSLFMGWHAASAQSSVTGTVHAQNGQPLHGAQIVVKDTGRGAVTDKAGHFHLSLPQGRYTLVIRFIGYGEKTERVDVDGRRPAKPLKIILVPQAVQGQTVTITAQGEQSKTGKYEVPVQSIRDIPSPLPDALLAVKMLPGVFSQNDQSNQYSVRGGSYDDNLILLNGIELFQPQLTRKAVAENPSPLNPALIQSMELLTGSAPVSLGDKTASVLTVAYRDSAEQVGGSAKATTVALEAALEGPIGKKGRHGHWMASARHIDYGYVFGGLRTEGQYNPRFTDLQAQLTLKPVQGQTLQLYGFAADSRYHALPTAENAQWDPIAQLIFYDFYLDGHETFDYETQAARASWFSNWTASLESAVEATYYTQKEHEDTFLRYSTTAPLPDSMDTEIDSTLTWLLDRQETFRNKLDLETFGLFASTTLRLGSHRLRAGAEYKRVRFDDDRYEAVEGEALLITDPVTPVQRLARYTVINHAAFLEHRWQLSPLVSMTWGLRAFHTLLNDETVFLPRWRLDWTLSERTDIALSAGRYAQPPMYKELLNTEAADRASVKSQKSLQAGFSIKHTWDPDFTFKAELFAKKMSDLISYDLWDVQAVYSGKNDAKGFAYGVDAQLSGPFIPDCASWLSYQYLVAREDLAGDGQGYVPRPADQRHTLALNFQDKMVRFPGSRLHVRLILGSGTYFTYRYRMQDEEGNYYLKDGPRNKYKLPYYQRFDIGFTQRFKWKGVAFTCREEVLNLFNRRNTLGYTWFAHQLMKRYLGGRVFNIGLEASF